MNRITFARFLAYDFTFLGHQMTFYSIQRDEIDNTFLRIFVIHSETNISTFSHKFPSVHR